MKAKIIYPSAAGGKTKPMHLSGEFKLMPPPPGAGLKFAPFFVPDNGKPGFLLDPRGIILDEESGEILYSPRMRPLDDFSDEMKVWLINHPNWGHEGTSLLDLSAK